METKINAGYCKECTERGVVETDIKMGSVGAILEFLASLGNRSSVS
jgi:hypothetical protein